MRFLRALLLAAGMLFLPIAAFAQVNVSVTIAPPELPVYEQPVCPGDGYIWTPGYWAWDGDDYYWVPGTWVEAPEVGYLWTPPYWGWGGSAFIFHAGYWGPRIGFYGGVVYGFGYDGRGYEGGRWEGGHFYYNRSVTNINVTVVHNVYEKRVDVRNVTRVSYNGGRGGIEARATHEQEEAEHERHLPPQAVQNQHVEAARSNRELRASVNHGKPAIAATPRPGAFNEHETAGHSKPAVHPKDLPPAEHHTPTPTGNAKVDQKYQKQQEKLNTQQDKQRQKLQQSQDKEHQRMQQQKVNEAKQQQVEQKHQQQTQHLQEKHVQQQQHLEQKQQPHQASPHQSAPPKEKH